MVINKIGKMLFFRDIFVNYDDIMLKYLRRYTPISKKVTVDNYRNIDVLLEIEKLIIECSIFYDELILRKDIDIDDMSTIQCDNIKQKDYIDHIFNK